MSLKSCCDSCMLNWDVNLDHTDAIGGLVTFLSRIVGAQQFFSISLNMCSIGWLILSANQNLRQTLWHAWPISSCWKHVFCRQCVNWTINTQYTFHSLNGCFFFKFLARFSLYTLIFRGAARPGKPKNANEQERQIIHIVDWCKHMLLIAQTHGY